MQDTLHTGLIGLLTGIVGTLSGSIIVFLVKEVQGKLLSFVLGISAGMMTVVVFLDLIPEALKMGTINSSLLGMFLGIILMYILDQIFPAEDFLGKKYGGYYKAGLFLAMGIALHNIPEGLAIGAGYNAASSLGFGIAVIIGMQNFPEGMAVATSLSLAGLNNLQIFLITLLAGVPMGIGSYLGAYFGNISQSFLSISLGFAAGAMLYIIFDDLTPAAQEKNKGSTAIFGILLGIFLGVYLTMRF